MSLRTNTNTMLIFIDKKAPEKAKELLSETGRVVEFQTHGMVYEAVSGHPDIFICQTPKGIVAAPGLPKEYKEILTEHNVNFLSGKENPGVQYPQTARYNALFTKYGILHNLKLTDPGILDLDKKQIHCSQGYTRCNTIEVKDIIFTSDMGVVKTLQNKSINSFYIEPGEIILKGFKNGFFGGCCGIMNSKFFVCGSFGYLKNGQVIRELIQQQGFEVIELYNGPLYDVGGIFFLT